MRNFLNIMFTLTEEQEESAYNLYISEVRNLRLRLESCEDRLIRQIRTPLERDDLHESVFRISEQEVSLRGRGPRSAQMGSRDLRRWPCDPSRALCRGHLVSSDCAHGWWQMRIRGSALPRTGWTRSTASSQFTWRLQGLSVRHLVTHKP